MRCLLPVPQLTLHGNHDDHGNQTKQKHLLPWQPNQTKTIITMATKLNKDIYHHGDQTKQKHLSPWRPY